jgi:hypothetical protein
MKFCFLVYFILFSIVSFSQQRKCVVIDKKSKLPIPYATIKGPAFGTYSDTLGFFQINENITDTFIVSSVGYVEAKFLFSSSKGYDSIFLEPKPLELPQITIGDYPWLSNNYTDQIGLKDIKKPSFSINVVEGLTVIKFFGNPDTSKRFIIGSLKIRVSQTSDLYIPRKVRIKIFAAINNFTIGDDIIKSSEIIAIQKPTDDFIEFDLNRFFVEAPKGGYFIGVEFLTPKIDAENAGSFALLGKLSKEFENGIVFSRYYSNTFRQYKLSETQKVNLFFNTRLYEYK